MKYIIVSYYTKNTLYEGYAKKLRKSLLYYHIPFHIEEIQNLGTWEDNINYKPKFLLKMLDKFDVEAIVWVDCDAEFLSCPILFDKLKSDFAVHIWRQPKRHKEELLSGTIFVGNTRKGKYVLEKWQDECKGRMKIKQPKPRQQWDQQSLAKVLEDIKFDELPGEYCKIYDRMLNIKEPIIIHNQASRIVRKNKGVLG